MRYIYLLTLVALTLCWGCDPEPKQAAPPPIRGLITTTVQEPQETVMRRYPGVLEPKDITALSFEVAGKLGKLNLTVGQRVKRGEVLATLNPAQFNIQIQNRLAAVEEADARLGQAVDDREREERLLQSGAGTQVAVDNARTNERATRAQLKQAQEALKSAREDLENSTIVAPFDGIINSVEVESFQTIGVGAPVTSIYDASQYEVSFSVNFDTVSDLVVGTPATVRLADAPSVTLKAVVSELGERADTVASFPVVVALRDDNPMIRAGMAVEVSFELRIRSTRQGYLIPSAAILPAGVIPEVVTPRSPTGLEIFVFHPATSTVQKRTIQISAIRENSVIVVDGLEPGEKVASAGVTFLRDGMKVKLIEPKE